jgi:hypothetical protein
MRSTTRLLAPKVSKNPEFVAQVAAVRDTLSPEDRTRLAILANNYGEAGALSLYGPQFNMPTPISSTNDFHDRGYGPYEPETVVVVGGELHDQELNFEHCTVAAQVRILTACVTKNPSITRRSSSATTSAIRGPQSGAIPMSLDESPARCPEVFRVIR